MKSQIVPEAEITMLSESHGQTIANQHVAPNFISKNVKLEHYEIFLMVVFHNFLTILSFLHIARIDMYVVFLYSFLKLNFKFNFKSFLI